ncbi:MAG: winged helix DNA-binding domain-containing protein [Microthrixaceae bacterium]
MRTLTATDVRRLRLRSNGLSPRTDDSAMGVVSRMGAMQAQEFWSGQWSVAARSSQLDDQAIIDATSRREILRTWPLRGTIHLIAAEDIHWMLKLAESFAFKGVERRREFLGLTLEEAQAAVEILRSALDDGEPVTRSRCVEILDDAGLMKDRGHAYHLLWFSSQMGAICIGPQEGKEQTFVSLERWVGRGVEMTRDEALASLAFRYFDGRGPVAAKELVRWTGLTAGDCKRAISLAGDRLVPVQTEFGEMLVSTGMAESIGVDSVDAPEPDRRMLLLSGFDEYMLGYGDRSAVITPEGAKKVVPGNNGMFRPTIVDDGQIIGTWKRTVTKTKVKITLEPFAGLTKSQVGGLDRAAEEYGDFIGLPAQVEL